MTSRWKRASSSVSLPGIHHQLLRAGVGVVLEALDLYVDGTPTFFPLHLWNRFYS